MKISNETMKALVESAVVATICCWILAGLLFIAQCAEITP